MAYATYKYQPNSGEQYKATRSIAAVAEATPPSAASKHAAMGNVKGKMRGRMKMMKMKTSHGSHGSMYR